MRYILVYYILVSKHALGKLFGASRTTTREGFIITQDNILTNAMKNTIVSNSGGRTIPDYKREIEKLKQENEEMKQEIELLQMKLDCANKRCACFRNNQTDLNKKTK